MLTHHKMVLSQIFLPNSKIRLKNKMCESAVEGYQSCHECPTWFTNADICIRPLFLGTCQALSPLTTATLQVLSWLHLPEETGSSRNPECIIAPQNPLLEPQFLCLVGTGITLWASKDTRRHRSLTDTHKNNHIKSSPLCFCLKSVYLIIHLWLSMSTCCISYCSHGCDKMLGRSHLRKDTFI